MTDIKERPATNIELRDVAHHVIRCAVAFVEGDVETLRALSKADIELNERLARPASETKTPATLEDLLEIVELIGRVCLQDISTLGLKAKADAIHHRFVDRINEAKS